MTTPRVLTESTLTLAQAAAALPGSRGAGRCARFTLVRWAKRGVRGVKLDATKRGGVWVTSREAIDRFLAATTEAAGGEAAPERTPAERRRASRRAKEQLAAAGWL